MWIHPVGSGSGRDDLVAAFTTPREGDWGSGGRCALGGLCTPAHPNMTAIPHLPVLPRFSVVTPQQSCQFLAPAGTAKILGGHATNNLASFQAASAVASFDCGTSTGTCYANVTSLIGCGSMCCCAYR